MTTTKHTCGDAKPGIMDNKIMWAWISGMVEGIILGAHITIRYLM